MPSLREAMKNVAENTSRLLSPDLQVKVTKALNELEKKYDATQQKLKEALYDKVSLENEVLYLKNKLAEAKKELEEMSSTIKQKASSQAKKPATKKATTKKATTKKTTTKKTTTKKKK